jgi:hypothetical protein
MRGTSVPFEPNSKSGILPLYQEQAVNSGFSNRGVLLKNLHGAKRKIRLFSKEQMQTDSFVSSGSTPDFELQNHGIVFLLIPQSTSARSWVDDHIGRQNGFQPHYPTVVIEHRYVSDIVEGIRNDGLAVQS